MVTPVDLLHRGLTGAITSYLVQNDEPTLVDPGPATTMETLEGGLEELGVSLGDIRHLLLTHIHLDHAGVTGHLVSRFPAMTVHVHEDGAPYLADPTRLVASTRRTFGDLHDELWGDVLPVPTDRIRGWRPGERGPVRQVRPFSTPGHIGHHVAWLDEESGSILAGDSMGIILDPEAPAYPPTPPPAIDLAAWDQTLDLLVSIGAEQAGIAHSGLHPDVGGRCEQFRSVLQALEARVRSALDRGEETEDARAFGEEMIADLAIYRSSDELHRYFDVFRPEIDYAGVVRYVRKQEERAETTSH